MGGAGEGRGRRERGAGAGAGARGRAGGRAGARARADDEEVLGEGRAGAELLVLDALVVELAAEALALREVRDVLRRVLLGRARQAALAGGPRGPRRGARVGRGARGRQLLVAQRLPHPPHRPCCCSVLWVSVCGVSTRENGEHGVCEKKEREKKGKDNVQSGTEKRKEKEKRGKGKKHNHMTKNHQLKNRDTTVSDTTNVESNNNNNKRKTKEQTSEKHTHTQKKGDDRR